MTAPLHENHAGGSGRRLPDNQQGMRRRNLSRVMHTVNAEGPLSRAGVAAHIGLTRAAVSTLVDELIRSGLLEELGPERPGRVGRPGSALALSGRGPAGIGAEIGVDHLAVCAVDLRGDVRARAERHGPNRGRAPEPVIEELTQLVRQVVAEAEGEGLWPAGLAVAVPGLVASDTRTVVRAPNLDWHDTDVGALLPDDLPVTVDNEANFGGLAELWLGDGTPSDFLHVSAEIGIGGAVVVDGRLLRGTRGFAGELGHVPVRPEGPDCACGGRGCLEQYAGEEAVLRAAGLEPGEHRVEFLAERAAAGDKHVHRALRGAGTALGVALTGAVNLLDPRTVVLGGALAALAPWLLPSLERELARRTAGPACSVTVSRLGSDGPLLGAAHSVVRGVLDDPATAGVRP
ncbi:ROK family transcriptional regulator [Streptomyces caniscabiei]|uniref:ROK family transcriptional regulator n=1 Tax=Streptomyces caniscabiei TaxID=2746961 RepID=A0A927LE67_9ACTN|nr:ROK family transcriptional regulator [Streptomyces caniscabiei]MBD9727373.1 ROK family transcriptional regulator [Streptomyces caniscabiei]MDX3512738.1 ROK family transcriptional regulator [Streptomyces caniscabiei]MDX3722263.1 ROK family transcriptional regulator [Streptomyces caniscabiei]WEO28758.1 ROK family transcriptional regulator [Streptomyces caniscabiei]